MLRVYNTVILPFRALSAAYALWGMRDPGHAAEWRERRAVSLPAVRAGGLWIHGASVGEARIIRTLSETLRRRRPALPLLVSAVTPTGRASLPAPPDVDAAFFIPLDFAGYPDRLLRAVQPSGLVLIETELWPNLLHEAAVHALPVCLVNGRLSRERMTRYRRFQALYRPLLAGLGGIGAQSDVEAERFIELGAPPEKVHVTGNVKYDLPPPTSTAASLRQRFGLAAGRPVVVAGSTGPGEDAPVVEAFLQARAHHLDLFLVLAPRHPDRAADAFREAATREVHLHRLSSGDDARAGDCDGLLVDTVGELAGLYALASVAFVGGSLVPIGGHNVLEPAVCGVPVLFGPHLNHVAQDAEALERAGGARRVVNGSALGDAWATLLRDADLRNLMGAKAAELVRSNRGALDRTVDLVLSLLDGSTSPPLPGLR